MSRDSSAVLTRLQCYLDGKISPLFSKPFDPYLTENDFRRKGFHFRNDSILKITTTDPVTYEPVVSTVVNREIQDWLTEHQIDHMLITNRKPFNELVMLDDESVVSCWICFSNSDDAIQYKLTWG